MRDYIISSDTLYITSDNCNGYTLIEEKDRRFLCKMKSFRIINKSCGFYGFSYKLQRSYIVEKFNFTIKTPIIISNFKNIIFFPTSSPNLKKCVWLSYNNIDRYIRDKKGTKIFFKGGKILSIATSFTIIDNQITKCIKIEKYLENLNNEKVIS